MYKIGEEEMVVCPYNRFHVVSKLRIQKHILKCKKNYPDIQLATCFYNYSHKLKPGDMLKHYETCSQKNKLEGSRYYETTKQTSDAASVTKDSLGSNFPDINAKIRFLSDVSNLQTSWEEDGPEVSSSFDLGDSQLIKTDPSDENDSSDDDLEPLPLPKTASIAFLGRKQQQSVFESSVNTANESAKTESFQTSGFGRGISVLKESKPLSPDCTASQSSLQNDKFKQMRSSKLISEDTMSHCSESIVSSMFDDSTTLKSEDIIFDDNENGSSLFKGFDKCTKL